MLPYNRKIIEKQKSWWEQQFIEEDKVKNYVPFMLFLLGLLFVFL